MNKLVEINKNIVSVKYRFLKIGEEMGIRR
jgi:hypothetical protein